MEIIVITGVIALLYGCVEAYKDVKCYYNAYRAGAVRRHAREGMLNKEVVCYDLGRRKTLP